MLSDVRYHARIHSAYIPHTLVLQLWEELGFYYLGPIDGHDLDNLIPILENLRDSDSSKPVLLHIKVRGTLYLCLSFTVRACVCVCVAVAQRRRHVPVQGRRQRGARERQTQAFRQRPEHCTPTLHAIIDALARSVQRHAHITSSHAHAHYMCVCVCVCVYTYMCVYMYIKHVSRHHITRTQDAHWH